MSPLRVGLDITKASRPRDGIGTYTRELLEALTPHLGTLQLVLYDFESRDRAGELRAGLPGALEAIEIGHAPERDALDLFHATTWSLPPRYRGPLLFTVYDLTFLTHAETHTVANRLACLEGSLRARLRAAHFLAISDTTAAALRRHFEVEPSRLHRIYPGVGSAFSVGDPAEARRRALALGIGGDFVLSVGTHEPRKNLARLLEAHAGLPDALRQTFPLVLVGGEGWRREDLDDRLAAAADRVRLLGSVSREDLVALYRTTSLFVYPSLAEGFGLPIVEAMASGAPVLTSEGGATAETAGTAAALADPRSTEALRRGLEELLCSTEAREDLRKRGRERARDFSWEPSASLILKLYREIGTSS